MPILYKDLRQICLTGGVLGVKGTGFFSKVVKYFTKEEFTHVAMLVWHGTGLWVYEFVEGTGYQCSPASWWFSNRIGQAVFYGHPPLVVSARPELVMREANSFRGTKVKQHYGIVSLIKVAIAQWTKKDIKVYFKVCSTFLQHVWSKCGHEFEMTADPGNIMRIAERQSMLMPVDTSKELYK